MLVRGWRNYPLASSVDLENGQRKTVDSRNHLAKNIIDIQLKYKCADRLSETSLRVN